MVVMKPPCLETLRISALDDREERFCIRPTGAIEPLVESIRTVGLVQPPALVRRGGRPVLLSGWRRLAACRCLGMKELPALVLDVPDDREAFWLAVFENLAVRVYSPAEKADILSKLHGFGVEEGDLVRRILPRLGIPSTLSHLRHYLEFADFDRDTRLMVHRTRPDFETLKKFAALTREELERLRPFLELMGRNRQKELLSDLSELARIRGVGVGALLEQERLRLILEDAGTLEGERAERLRTAVRELRFPRLTEWKSRFADRIDRLALPLNVRVDPGMNFEEENMRISFWFKDGQEFRKTLDRLRDAAESPEGADFFRFDHED